MAYQLSGSADGPKPDLAGHRCPPSVARAWGYGSAARGRVPHGEIEHYVQKGWSGSWSGRHSDAAVRHGYIHQIEGEVSRRRLEFQLGSLSDFLRGKFSPSQFFLRAFACRGRLKRWGPNFAAEAR